MATIPVTPLVKGSGVNLQMLAAAAGGDQFPISGQEDVIIRNLGGASINATFVAQNVCNQGVVHNLVVVVPNTANMETHVRGLDPQRFADGNKMCQITYSAVVTVWIGITSG